MNALGVSDMTKKIGVQGGCVGVDGDRDVGNRGSSSTMASSLTKRRRRKHMGSSLVKVNCS